MNSGAIIARIIVVAAAVAALLAAPARAQDLPPGPGQEVPDQGPVLQAPVARFDWSVPERYEQGWAAWSERDAAYDRAYVRPDTWAVRIDACGSSGNGEPLVGYDVTVAAVGSSFRARSVGSACSRSFTNLPRLGRYDVTVVVSTRRGPSEPSTERIELQDHLVVSLGDSMASGEGVPDAPGIYTTGSSIPQTVATLTRIYNGEIRFATQRAAVWRDRRCHRSARAGHALAASALERRDPRSSVTYISLACSGATIADVIDQRYAGIQPPPNGGTVEPQLEALRDLVGERRIDALLLAVGVNDLGFASIVKSCAKSWNGSHGQGDPDCVYDSGASRKLTPGGTIDRSYAELGAALRESLDVGEVYVTDYPAEPFGRSRGGCGLLAIPGFGIAPREAEAMSSVGLQLYWAVGRAAAAQGWNWVPGMTDAFDGHDYCASDPYLVHLEPSLFEQGTIDGAVHPTRSGHAAFANLLLTAAMFRPELPYWRARLVVEQVRVEHDFHGVPLEREEQDPGPAETGEPIPPPPPSDRYAFDLSVRTIGNWPAGRGNRFTIPKSRAGEWIAVPAGLGSFELDVNDPPRPPRHPTSVDFLAYGPSGTLGADHTYAQGFGAGCHERRHQSGWSIRYRIEVRIVDGRPHPPGDSMTCRQDGSQ